MLTLAVQVCFLAIVRASELSLPLQARSTPCGSYGDGLYGNRACGDICLPVGEICCGNVPASSLLYACPIGRVCNDYWINNNDYLARCCDGTWSSCDVVTPFPSTSYIPTTPTQTSSTSLPSTACGPQVQAEGYGYRNCGDICLPVDEFCCGFLPDTNFAFSCTVGDACLISSNMNQPMCCDASGYCLYVSSFAAGPTPTRTLSQSTGTTSIFPQSTGVTTTTFSPTQTTSSGGLATSTTGGGPAPSSVVTSESASPIVTTTTKINSSMTNQSPITSTGTVLVGLSSMANTTSPSSPSFTGAAARDYPIGNGVIYVLGGLFVGAVAGDLGLF